MTVEATLTIFSIPKPFVGDTAIRQENALCSWLQLPGAEVVLLGSDDEVGDKARSFGVKHIGDLRRSPYGTPLVSDAFDKVRQVAKSNRLCYVNADILLFDDLLKATEAVTFREFLITGCRWNLDVKGPMDVSLVRERTRVLSALKLYGKADYTGYDFFVFPRHIDWEMPDFAVGRPTWDNWLLYTALKKKIPLVDVSPSVVVIHQLHDYEHVPGSTGHKWEGPEAEFNRALIDVTREFAELDSATHVLRNGTVRRARGWRYLRARLLFIERHSQIARVPISTTRSIWQRLRRGRRDFD